MTSERQGTAEEDTAEERESSSGRKSSHAGRRAVPKTPHKHGASVEMTEVTQCRSRALSIVMWGHTQVIRCAAATAALLGWLLPYLRAFPTQFRPHTAITCVSRFIFGIPACRASRLISTCLLITRIKSLTWPAKQRGSRCIIVWGAKGHATSLGFIGKGELTALFHHKLTLTVCTQSLPAFPILTRAADISGGPQSAGVSIPPSMHG